MLAKWEHQSPSFSPAPATNLRLPRRRARPAPTCCADPSASERAPHAAKHPLPDGGALHLRHYPPSAASTAENTQHAPPPDVLLIHDFMTDGRLFSRLAQASALRARPLCAVDMRGFGQSTQPTAPYSRTDDLARVAAALPARPHLVGVGLGGVAALELALASPAAVRSVSVVCSGLPGHRWSSLSLYIDISAAQRAGQLLLAGVKTGGSGGTSGSGGGGGNGDASRDVVQWKQRFIATNRTWGDVLARAEHRDVARELIAMARDYSGYHFFGNEQLVPDPFEDEPLSTRVSQLAVPARVLVGQLDTPDFRAIAGEIWDAVEDAGSAVVEVPNAGHFAVMEEPDFVAQQLEEFWNEVEGRGERDS